MKFSVNSRIFTDFDNPRLAVLVVRDANNTANITDLDFNSLEQRIRDDYKSETLSQTPKIAAWREAHRKFGSKPKEYLSSIEALYKRILKGQELGSINPLVDIYNYVSIKYMLPIGGEDLDKVEGDLQLTLATNNETAVIVLGKDEPQAPKPGEVIYKDSKGTICRRWNWREVSRTILTDKTLNCILVIEAIGPVTDKELSEASQELKSLVLKYCQGTVTEYLVNGNNSEISL